MSLKSEHSASDLAALEDVLLRLDELLIVLGPSVAPTLGAVRAFLIEGVAARDRGDGAAAVAAIGKAMDSLSSLADNLDPAEATLMRAVAQGFRAALQRGDYAGARQSAATMMRKSGATEREKK